MNRRSRRRQLSGAARAARGASVTRREAIGLIGIGAGFAFAAGCGGAQTPEPVGEDAAVGPAGSLAGDGPPGGGVFPEGAVIRAILEDLPPEALAGGATLFHEHLDLFQGYSSPPSGRGRGAPPLTDEEAETFVALVAEELRMAAGDGMSCIVDAAIHRRSDRELELLRRMSRRSGVPVVVAGSYWKAPYPDEVAAMSVEEMTEHLVTDARAQNWGAFGEVGTSMRMHETERRFLRAIGRAHHATGLPIFTHTEHQGCRPCGLEQLDMLESEQVDFGRVCIGHLSDVTPEQDPGWTSHLEIARRGAYVGFDTVGRALALDSSPDIPEAEKVKMVLNVLEAGYADQVLLASDFARSADLKSNWGNGFATAIVQFVPKLRHAGVDDATLRRITVDNPRRFLAFTPQEA